jgi:hypothetical protein
VILTMMTYVLLAVALILGVLWWNRRSANKRAR